MRTIILIILAAILVPSAVCAQAPEITGHTVIGMKRVDFVFSQLMQPANFEHPGNVRLYPTGSPGDTLETWSVYLDGDRITMHLRLIDPMQEGASYTLSLRSIYSYWWVPVPDGYEYTFTADDLAPPELHSIAFLAPNRLDLVLTEEVLESEGQNALNYSLFETADPGHVIGITSTRMRGVYERVMLELGEAMTPGMQYTITAADLHDPAGNALPPGSDLTFTYTGSNDRSLVGLYADGNRYNTEVNGTGAYSFDLWMWMRTGGDGAYAALFTMDYPSNVTPFGIELNPNFEFLSGDVYNGACISFKACQYDWVWIFKQTVAVSDALPSLISVVPIRNELLFKDTYILRCDSGHPLEPMNVTSAIEVNAPDARPVAIDASVSGYSVINILFSVAMDETTAEMITNYEVFEAAAPGNTLPLASATLQADGRTVWLVTASPMTEGMEYTARMTGIEDAAGIAIYPGSEISFPAIDTKRPVLLSAAMSAQHTVDLLFDEPVDDATASSVLNYDIVLSSNPSLGLDLYSAQLLGDEVTVRLTVTSPMADGTDYTAIASNVKDLWGHTMLSASTAEFTADDIYPPRVIFVYAQPGDVVKVAFDEVVDSATAVDLLNYQIRLDLSHPPLPLTAITWNGDEVFISRDGSYTFGAMYDLLVMNIEDPAGNAIPTWESISFYYTPETPEPLIGLWADSERLNSSVEAYPFSPFEFYVWCKPGAHGLKALEFAFKNTSLQNFNCVIAGIQYNPDCASSMGDVYSGIAMVFNNCQTDWFWAVRYTFFLLDGKGYIDVVPIPDPLAGGIHGALCLLPTYPIVELSPVSRLTVNEFLIGTLLQSSSAEYNGAGIEVSWVMREMDGEPSFIISRMRADEGAFTPMDASVIERDGMEFRFIDNAIQRGASYNYRVEYEVGGEIRTLFQTDEIATPSLPLTLHQNCPNPFNPSTVIGYCLPERCTVRLEVFDAAGKHVALLANGEQGPGEHRVEWNGINSSGSRASSGIYFYRLTAGKETISRKMVLLR